MFIPTEPVTLGVSAGVMTQTTAMTSQHTRLPWQHYNHDVSPSHSTDNEKIRLKKKFRSVDFKLVWEDDRRSRKRTFFLPHLILSFFFFIFFVLIFLLFIESVIVIFLCLSVDLFPFPSVDSVFSKFLYHLRFFYLSLSFNILLPTYISFLFSGRFST